MQKATSPRMGYVQTLRKFLVVFAVMVGVLMSADILFLQAGVDGLGISEKYQGTVVYAEPTTLHKRVSKSGSEPAISLAVPAMSVAFTYERAGKVATSTRYFLLGDGDLEVPLSRLEDPALLRVGAQVPVYYVPSTNVAFVEFGLAHAIAYWLKFYAVLALFACFGVSVVYLGKWSQQREA